MESNIKQFECRNFIPKSGENGKRSASGRLSPRTLFGNIKVKRPFQEEEAVSRNLNNSKNSHGWKPPLKVDSNEPNKFSSNDCDMETLSCFPNHETNLSQNQNFILNESHCSRSNKNLYPPDNDTDYHVESDDHFRGNSEETVVYNSEFPNQDNLINDQDIDYSEEDIRHHLVSSEISVKPDPNRNEIDCAQENKKQGFSGNDDEYLQRSFQDSYVHMPSTSRNEICDENEIYDPIDETSQDTVKLSRDNLVDYEVIEIFDKDEESSNSTVELCDSKKFLMEINDNQNNNITQEINRRNFQEDTDKPTSRREVDDSFDLGITNSQFLQLENQISKSSIGLNMESSKHSRSFLKNIETMKRYCTSMAAQAEWQKNLLKCITRDIDDLNKSIVRVTASMRSLRKSNTTSK